jgi:hypothetical protein
MSKTPDEAIQQRDALLKKFGEAMTTDARKETKP